MSLVGFVAGVSARLEHQMWNRKRCALANGVDSWMYPQPSVGPLWKIPI